jgi:hypothetical protein
VVLPWSTWAMMAILRIGRDMDTALLLKRARILAQGRVHALPQDAKITE